MKLRLASGHFSVAGAELADKVVPGKVDTKSRLLQSAGPEIHKGAGLIRPLCAAFRTSVILGAANALQGNRRRGTSRRSSSFQGVNKCRRSVAKEQTGHKC